MVGLALGVFGVGRLELHKGQHAGLRQRGEATAITGVVVAAVAAGGVDHDSLQIRREVAGWDKY